VIALTILSEVVLSQKIPARNAASHYACPTDSQRGWFNMIILGIETSTPAAGLALISQEVIAEIRLSGPDHSEFLIPSLDWVLSYTKLSIKDVSAVAFSAGPGAFTGLRIGLGTAKGLSFSMNIPLVMVPTLDAIAYRMTFCGEKLCVLSDARRREVYASIYDMSDGFPESLYGPEVLPLERLLEKIEGRAVFSGDGAIAFRERIEEYMGERALFAPCHIAHTSAAAVASLGTEMLRREQIADPLTAEPIYIRKSDAKPPRRKPRGG
jgi:tRNA threonylcarbamoyladenosine biosynthesis protein TsaB